MKKSLLIAMLVGMGISKANAEKIAATTPEDGGTMDQPEIDTLIASWKQEQIALMENEPAIVDKIKSAEKSRHYSEFERKVKQTFGLTSEEIAGKKFDEIIALAKQKAQVGGDKTLTDLQEEIVKLTNEKKELEDVKIPAIRAEVDTHKKQISISQKLRSKIPNSEDAIRIPYETAVKLVNGDISELYDLDEDDKGEIVIKVKGTGLFPKTKDGTKLLTIDDVINERLETHGALKKSNAKPPGKEGVFVEKDKGEPDGGQKPKNTLNLNAAEQHLAKLKAEDEARATGK